MSVVASVPPPEIEKDDSLNVKHNDRGFADERNDEVSDVDMKEKEESQIDPNLKSDSTSNFDPVPKPDKNLMLSPKKLEIKPLGSLLLEAVMETSPNPIGDHLTESM